MSTSRACFGDAVPLQIVTLEALGLSRQAQKSRIRISLEALHNRIHILWPRGHQRKPLAGSETRLPSYRSSLDTCRQARRDLQSADWARSL